MSLKDLQKGMPHGLKKQHDAMTAAEAFKAEENLRNEALKCHHFGNDCPSRGPDRLMQAGNDFQRRADYFKLLGESKIAAAKEEGDTNAKF